ncbi:glycoside hydrolase family 18 protein [Aureibaculum sp. 2210JD6-5]|uniref:glycoside hydrolase family 18 protein n=1 Tax=Aureibaculum sp. 2210JD6-5 TaxID=3103957 RepID=UPI002AAC81AF|nr:glycoside hydrolase family 18 protein [Aureibaculum sp. 2210JD6-5]MDY7395453.1 glycoside hydrolase family 18 protein [Aureibaculum sp. 2210JD6-5]
MRYFLSLIIGIVFSSCSQNNKEQEETKEPVDSKYKVIAYVQGHKDNWGTNFEKAKQITHINYAFANIKDGKVIEGYSSDTEALKKLNELKQVNPKLKILISVGGWSWSKNFSDAALTEQSREVFANSAIDFMQKHNIDGIDLDWEYPGQIGDNNTFRPEDKENFTAILKLIREKLEALKPNTYLLTIATGANQAYLDHTNLAEAHKYLDFINIMTYDYYTGGWHGTGHHSSLFQSEFNPQAMYSAKAVDQHVKAGIPIEKLVLGVPFYGRWWKGANAENNGLYQNSAGERGGYSFKEIEENYIDKNGFESLWDDSAKAPYLWNATEKQFVTYENAKSLKFKIDYIKEKKMGGVMFWQFSQDSGTLLNTISNNLK